MSTELEVAEALKHIALDESIKAYVLQNPPLYHAACRASMRFIGGETLDDCTSVARDINNQGHAVTIDFMGESTRDEAMADQATREFLSVVQMIEQHNFSASVSLDLSHIGMIINPELGYQNAATLAQAAQEAGLEVMISMEGTDRTTLILDIHGRLCRQFSNVGITLQAYLYRSQNDLATILKRPGKIRLVKGAYEAPSELVHAKGSSLDAAYCQLMDLLLQDGHTCSIATHDPLILNHAHQVIQEQNLNSLNIEFEMLKGVTLERLEEVRQQGYCTRIYLPYGKEWHLYLFNRLAEYPPNLYQAIIDVVAKGEVSTSQYGLVA